jgi:hypothetical protein
MTVLAGDAAGNWSAASASLVVTTAPNSPPSATLTSPSVGAVLSSNTPVTLTASASDSDGSIAQVEFFIDGVKVGDGVAQNPTTFTLDLPGGLVAGDHTFTVRTTDNSGAVTDTAPVSIRVLASLPYFSNFESSEGYDAGSIAGQRGWEVGPGAAIIGTSSASSGSQSVELLPASPPTLLARSFAPQTGQPIVFVDFFAQPVAEVDPASATTFDVESSRLNFQNHGSGQGVLRVFDGDGTGGGTWVVTKYATPIGAADRTTNWVRLTVRIDFTAKTWDVYAGGTMVAADLHFRDNSATDLSLVTVSGDTATSSLLDDLFAAAENPLFPDADLDGLDDNWEIANGLDPNVNDRNSDLDGDGLSNLREYLLGTKANLGDTDGDGMPDGWEAAHGLNPLVNDAAGDLDGDGTTNLAEYTAGRNPNDIADATPLPTGYQIVMKTSSGSYYGITSAWALTTVSGP